MTCPSPPLLELENLALDFEGGAKPAVRDFSLKLAPGEIVGLVGESGSGKSVSALYLMGLLPPSAKVRSGRLFFKGEDLSRLSPRRRRRLCGSKMGLIFQEPMTALNPVLTIGEQVEEIFRLRAGQDRRAARASALNLLARVGLPNPLEAAERYPHHFSGGMRQRVVIALALALAPEVLLADEPTTALDPTIAAQILNLLTRLAAEDGSAVLLITHNLRLLKHRAHRIIVMYAGLVLEEAADLFTRPAHPYTIGLLEALPPALDEPVPYRLKAIPGTPPSPGAWPPGCPFEPRCPLAAPLCRKTLPHLRDLESGRRARCFFPAGQTAC